jgi:hypothetical protein
MIEEKIVNNNCPCCSTQMFRQIHGQKVYWFCPSCYQEMPNLAEIITGRKREQIQLIPTRFLLNLEASKTKV